MRIVLYSIFLLTLFTMPLSAQAQYAKLSIDDLGWMAGCWEMTMPAANGPLSISEQWMKPAGGTIIGMSRTVSGGKTSAWEFMRIASVAGKVSFIARPSSNQQDTIFTVAKSSTSEAVFENSGHDFPQRVIYRNAGPNNLFARIEGTRDGKMSGMDFPMKRAKCEL